MKQKSGESNLKCSGCSRKMEICMITTKNYNSEGGITPNLLSVLSAIPPVKQGGHLQTL